MSNAERQPIKIRGIVAHHRAEIPNPLGLPDGDNSRAKVTFQITPERGLADQSVAKIDPRPYSVRGENAQAVYGKLLMRDLKVGDAIEVTYDPEQVVPKAGEGWEIDSITAKVGEKKETVVLDFKNPTEKTI